MALSADGRTALVGAPLGGPGDGAAYVYTEAGGTWSATPAATFTGSSGEALGTSVALSADGGTALVGATSAGSGDGAAYVYAESGGSWSSTPAATFAGSGGESLGNSVALSADGGTALVGAPSAGSGDGAAYVYAESGGSWSSTPAATFAGSGDEQLGWSVALSADGGTALVGAPQASSNDGAAYVYADSAGSWSSTPAATFTGSGGEQLGWSVALSADGGTALVGAPQASSGDDGAAYVYAESGGSWSSTPAATFTGSGGGLGWSVALSADGRTALVGAPGAGLLDGAAYAYAEAGGTWPSAPAATFAGSGGEYLGWSVALSADGQTALVGAAFAGSNNGAAYTYGTPSTSTWAGSPAATFTGSASESLGYSVALSADGQTALVGAAFAGSTDGAAYVYTDSDGSWGTAATFTGAGEESLGFSVALSADGGTALVGAPNAGSFDGAAYVYAESGGTWSTTPAATFTGASTGEALGFSVALSADGQTALVGVPYAGSDDGAAYVYAESGGTWASTPAATFTGASTGEALGFSVALSADGQTALVGVPYAGSDYDDGAAYVYAESGGTWASTPAATFTGSGGESLGNSVALSADGGTALIGAPNAGSFDGAAYVYAESGGTWASTPAATFTGSGGGYLGYSVALSADGQTALIGAPNAGSFDGAAYVYAESGGTWASTPAATFTGSGGGNLGYSVALSADRGTALVGALDAGSGAGAAYVYTQLFSVVVQASGSQAYASSSPTFGYTDDAPGGLTVSGTLACTTVGGGTPIGTSLAVGTYTLDGPNCGGLYLSGSGASSYAISYVGATGGYVVNKGAQAISFSAPAPGTVGTTATLSATGGPSGNAVVFGVDATSGAGVCNVSGIDGTTLGYTAPGSCVVDANQATSTRLRGCARSATEHRRGGRTGPPRAAQAISLAPPPRAPWARRRRCLRRAAHLATRWCSASTPPAGRGCATSRALTAPLSATPPPAAAWSMPTRRVTPRTPQHRRYNGASSWWRHRPPRVPARRSALPSCPSTAGPISAHRPPRPRQDWP